MKTTDPDFLVHQQQDQADAIAIGNLHLDIKAKLAILKTQVEQSSEVLKIFHPPVWKPKIGECLAGIFLGYQKCSETYNTYEEPHAEDWQILIQDDSGNVHAIWGTPELKNKLRGPSSPCVEHGNLVAITFLGIGFTSNGTPYRTYGVVADKLNKVSLRLFI